jgi:cyanate permease
MLIAGIVGALVLPVLSDRGRRRRPFLLLSTACMLPGLLGLVLFRDYTLLLVSSFVFGFFLLGGGAPIGFQYAAEVSYPAPESTSQGLILLVGQASGIALIVGINALGTTPSLWLFAAFGVVIVGLSAALQESPVILVDGARVDAAEEPG